MNTAQGRPPFSWHTLSASCLILSLVLTLIPASNYAAGPETIVIDLKNRTAEELIPLIKPHIPGLRLSGRAYQLIARGSQDELQSLKDMLEQLDTALQRLRITADFSGGKYAADQGVSASGQISNRGSDVTVRSYGTRSRDNSSQVQNIITLDGKPAFIQSGRSVPVGRTRSYPDGRHYGGESGIQYRDVITGIHVLPHKQGDQITLFVRAERGDQVKYRKIFTRQAAETVVRGKLGEWILLGGVSHTGASDSNAITYSTRSRDQRFGNIRIRVTVE